MKIRIATYNAMNLFRRARPISVVEDWKENQPVLQDIAQLNTILEKETYSPDDIQAISDILVRNNLANQSRKDDKFRINQIREKLYTNPSPGVINVKAKGRGDWLGWVEPVPELLSSEAIGNTARVIQGVDADILCLVEVEDRVTLEEYHQSILVNEGFLADSHRYPYNMSIQGNDDRGINVGIYSRFSINRMVSHIKDTYSSGGKDYPVFSRDCAEYEIQIPSGQSIWMLVNHLKSKGYGSINEDNAKRKHQAERIRQILQNYDLKTQLVVVAGDFNDTPNSPSLSPLLSMADLHSALDQLPKEERGTYKDGSQIDYLLVSTPLWQFIGNVAVERRGIFRKSALGKPNEMFPEVKNLESQASDHGAVRADFQL